MYDTITWADIAEMEQDEPNLCTECGDEACIGDWLCQECRDEHYAELVRIEDEMGFDGQEDY